MTRKGEHIDVLLGNVYRNVTYSLYSIGVKKNSLFVTYPADLGDRLDSADLVVSIHYSNKSCLVGDSFGYLFG